MWAATSSFVRSCSSRFASRTAARRSLVAACASRIISRHSPAAASSRSSSLTAASSLIGSARSFPVSMLGQLLLASVVDQQAIRTKPDTRRAEVWRQPAVVHEVLDRNAAGDFGEVSDKPPVAAPPDALAAHHGQPLRGGLGENLVDGRTQVRFALPHATPSEPRLPPCHIG